MICVYFNNKINVNMDILWLLQELSHVINLGLGILSPKTPVETGTEFDGMEYTIVSFQYQNAFLYCPTEKCQEDEAGAPFNNVGIIPHAVSFVAFARPPQSDDVANVSIGLKPSTSCVLRSSVMSIGFSFCCHLLYVPNSGYSMINSYNPLILYL